jgi:hypothetical protein
MLKDFLNLRKRLLFGQLAVLGLVGSTGFNARAAGLLDRAFEAASQGEFSVEAPPAFNPSQFRELFEQQARVSSLHYAKIALGRGMNPPFAQRLLSLPPSLLMSMGLVPNPEELASDEVASSFGIASPGKTQQFRAMLGALQAQWAKQGKKLALSEADMQKLLDLLAKGQSLEGQSEIDPKLLAAVQASADNFGKAGSDQERQQIVSQFNDSLGEIASHVGGDTGALLGSVHGAVSDSLASGEPIAAPDMVVASDSQSGDTSRIATEEVFKGLDLTNAPSFSEQYVNEDKLSGTDTGTMMASNGWLKPGDVDRLTSRQADDSSSGTRNFNGYRPQAKVEGASPSDTTQAPTGGTTTDAKASAHEASIKSRLDSLTAEMKQKRPSTSHGGTTPAPPSSSGTRVASNTPAPSPSTPSNTGNTSPASEFGPPASLAANTPKPNATEVASANSGLANLARIEAANLGISDKTKIDQFVNDYVKQNTVADNFTPVVVKQDPVAASGNGPGTLNAFGASGGSPAAHNSAGSGGGAGGAASGGGAAGGYGSVCEVASRDPLIQGLTTAFITRYRVGLEAKSTIDNSMKVVAKNPGAESMIADAGSSVLNESSKTCTLYDPTCNAADGVGSATSQNIDKEKAVDIVKHGKSSTVDISGIAESLIATRLAANKTNRGALPDVAEAMMGRLRQLMQQKGFCPSSADIAVLDKTGELKKFSDIYTQALYEELANHGDLALDSKGCPAIQSVNGTANTANLDTFVKFVTQVSSQERDVHNILLGSGQGEETWCSHGTLETEPFSMKPIAGTFFGSLKDKCSVSLQMATERIYEGWQSAKFANLRPQQSAIKEPKELRANCLTQKTAYLAMRTMGFSRQSKVSPMKFVGDDGAGTVHE